MINRFQKNKQINISFKRLTYNIILETILTSLQYKALILAIINLSIVLFIQVYYTIYTSLYNLIERQPCRVFIRKSYSSKKGDVNMKPPPSQKPHHRLLIGSEKQARAH